MWNCGLFLKTFFVHLEFLFLNIWMIDDFKKSFFPVHFSFFDMFFQCSFVGLFNLFQGCFYSRLSWCFDFFFNSFPLQFPMLFHLFDLTFKCVFSFTILGCFHFFRTFWLLVVFCQIPKLLTCSFCKHSCFDFC